MLSSRRIQIYPDHQWELWRFSPAPHGFWSSQLQKGDDTALTALLTKKVGPSLRVGQLDDWYRVSSQDLKALGVSHIVAMYGGFPNVLRRAFPDHSWSVEILMRRVPKKSQQLRLLQALQVIFPGRSIVEEARNAQIRGSAELDLTIPDLSLAVEFQGEHHFSDILDVGLAAVKASTDERKAALLASKGLSLISVPYWWDGSTDSLANTIRSIRPDLIAQAAGNGKAIPEEPQAKKSRHGKPQLQ